VGSSRTVAVAFIFFVSAPQPLSFPNWLQSVVHFGADNAKSSLSNFARPRESLKTVMEHQALVLFLRLLILEDMTP